MMTPYVAIIWLLLLISPGLATNQRCEDAQATLDPANPASPSAIKFNQQNFAEVLARVEPGAPLQWTSIRGNVRKARFLGVHSDTIAAIQEEDGALVYYKVGSLQEGEIGPPLAVSPEVGEVRARNKEFVQKELFGADRAIVEREGFPEKVWLVVDPKTGLMLSSTRQMPDEIPDGLACLELAFNPLTGAMREIQRGAGRSPTFEASAALYPSLYAEFKNPVQFSTSVYQENDFVSLRIVQKNAVGARRKIPIKGWVYRTFTDGSAIFLPEGGHSHGEMIVIGNLQAAEPTVLKQKNMGAGSQGNSYPNTPQRLTDQVVDALKLGAELPKDSEAPAEKQTHMWVDRRTGKLILGPGVTANAAALYLAETEGVKIPVTYKYESGKLTEISYTRTTQLSNAGAQILTDAIAASLSPAKAPRRPNQ